MYHLCIKLLNAGISFCPLNWFGQPSPPISYFHVQLETVNIFMKHYCIYHVEHNESEIKKRKKHEDFMKYSFRHYAVRNECGVIRTNTWNKCWQSIFVGLVILLSSYTMSHVFVILFVISAGVKTSLTNILLTHYKLHTK